MTGGREVARYDGGREELDMTGGREVARYDRRKGGN